LAEELRAYRRCVTYTPRDEEPGYHHVGARGNNKQRIYLNDRDRQLFLLMLNHIAKKHDWRILAYCLMRNHYHLVLRVGEAGLARGMCELNTGYAVSFNGTHGRINHLFGKRYWSERATSDEHLKSAIRYVLQNPRRAGAKGPLDSHRWTSYRATVGKAYGLPRFARDELLSIFGRNPAQALKAFMAFCEEPPPSRP
jgi:putative transposase